MGVMKGEFDGFSMWIKFEVACCGCPSVSDGFEEFTCTGLELMKMGWFAGTPDLTG